MERQQAANSIKNLEAKLRELQEALMAKVRELGLAYNAHLPLDLELDAFATLLEAEERRWSFYPRFILILHVFSFFWGFNDCSKKYQLYADVARDGVMCLSLKKLTKKLFLRK